MSDDQSVMSRLVKWKREQKWNDVDKFVEKFRRCHRELEQNLDNPERIKQISAEIRTIDSEFIHAMS